MRRRPGVAGLQTAAAARGQYKALGENVARQRQETIKEQLETFRRHLQEFAQKHKNDIRKNPEFRAQFHAMCARCGVDPLASNKGFWAELLGIGDFYYELGVQIVEACIASRPANGGVINLQQLRQMVATRRRASVESITEDDCIRAIKTLKALGSGFDVQTVGAIKIVRSLPLELNTDQNGVMEIAQVRGFVTVAEVTANKGWLQGRATDALDALLKEGLVMIDDGDEDGVRRYWFPCFDTLTVDDGTAAAE